MEIKFVGKCLLIEHVGKKILVVGDLHLGFDEMLVEAGNFAVKKGYMFKEMIKEFDKIFEKTGKVDEIVLLGDIKHDFGKISKQEWQDILKLIDYLKNKCNNITVIFGNHDNMIGPIMNKRKIKVKKFYIVGRYFLAHGDKNYSEMWDKKIKNIIVGHGHPAVRLKEGVKVEKYKCFLEGKYEGKNFIVVPSFFEYNVGSDPRDGGVVLAWNINFNNFNVKIVGENLNVLDFGKLKNLE